jgi:predicted DNA binding CopG/RHH family protein
VVREPEVHDQELAAAVEKGAAQVPTPEKLRERIAASRAKMPAQVISLRVPEADFALARRQAVQKGLPYQTSSNRYCTNPCCSSSKVSAGLGAPRRSPGHLTGHIDCAIFGIPDFTIDSSCPPIITRLDLLNGGKHSATPAAPRWRVKSY